MSRLSKPEIQKLILLARRAYEHAGRTAAEPLPDFDTWRREQVNIACGKHGLTDCINADFNLVAAHCHSILGEDGVAFEELLRAGTELRRQLEVVLIRELEAAGLPQAYCESISRSRFGKNVTDLDDEQFRQLLFTTKARGRSRRRKRRKQLEAAAA